MYDFCRRLNSTLLLHFHLFFYHGLHRQRLICLPFWHWRSSGHLTTVIVVTIIVAIWRCWCAFAIAIFLEGRWRSTIHVRVVVRWRLLGGDCRRCGAFLRLCFRAISSSFCCWRTRSNSCGATGLRPVLRCRQTDRTNGPMTAS